MRQHAPHSPVYGFVEGNDKSVCVQATDWLGNVFKLGDTVIYCIGAGRGQMMALGVVTMILVEHKKHEYWRNPQPGEEPTVMRHTFIHATCQYAEIPQVRVVEEWDELAVQVLTSKTSGLWGSRQRTRKAFVNPMNITALPVGVRNEDSPDSIVPDQHDRDNRNDR